MTPQEQAERRKDASVSKILFAQWAIVIVIGVLMLCAPFARGLFFSGGQEVVATIVLWAGAVGLILAFFRLKVSLNWIDLAAVLYVLLYVSGPLHSADGLLSAIGAWTSLAVGMVYISVRILYQMAPLRLSFVLHVFALSSVVLAVVGFANAWHQLKFPSAYAPRTPEVRLSSVFQYHNTFASFEGAVATGLLVVILTSSSRLIQALYSGAVGIALLAVLEARSRGEELVLILLWIIILAIHRGVRRSVLPYLLRWIPAIIPGTVVTALAMAHGVALSGWFGIAMLLFIPFLAMWYFPLPTSMPDDSSHKKENAEGRSRYRARSAALGGGIIVALIIVAAFAARHLIGRYVDARVAAGDFVARLVYWKDSFSIFKLSPIWGFGAGAWRDMWQMVRTQNYYVTQVHSSLFQALVDGGIIGAILWVALGIGVLVAVIRLAGSYSSSDKTLAANLPFGFGVLALGLYAHSLFDWDMSFLYIKLVFIIALGVTVSAVPWKSWNLKSIWLGRTLGGVMIVVCLIGGWASWSALRAQNATEELSATTSSDQQLALAEKAHALAPYSAQYMLNLGKAEANMGNTNAELADFAKAQRMNLYNPQLQLTVAVAMDKAGKIQVGYEAAKQAFVDNPMEGSLLSQYANASALYSLETFSTDRTVAENTAEVTLQNASSWKEGIQASPLSVYSDTSLGALALVVHKPALAIQWVTPAVGSSSATTSDMGQLVVDAAHVEEGTPNSAAVLNTFVAAHSLVRSSYQLLSPVIRH